MLRTIVRISRLMSIPQLKNRNWTLSSLGEAVCPVGRRSFRLLVIPFMALGSMAAMAQDSTEKPAAAATVKVSLLDYDFWPTEKDESWAEICPQAVRQPLQSLVDAAQAKPHPSLQELKAMREAARGAAPESPLPDFAYALACEQAGYPSECEFAFPALAGKDLAFFLPARRACAMWQLEHARERDLASQLPDAFAATLSEHQIKKLSEAQFGQAVEWIGTVSALMLETRRLDNKRRQSLEQFSSEIQAHAVAGPHFTRGLERMRVAIEAARAQGLVDVSRADEKKIASIEKTLTSLEEKGTRLSDEKSKSASDREILRQQAVEQIAQVDEAVEKLKVEYLRLYQLQTSLSQFYREMHGRTKNSNQSPLGARRV